MQVKSILLISGFTALATCTAIPAPVAVADDATIQARATQQWTASGGCKTDWGGRCYAMCLGEAQTKWPNLDCTSVSGVISGSNCWVGWNICRCTCFY